MSRSNKPRYGMKCRFWKDTMLAGKNQKRAYTKRKKKQTRAQRHADNASVAKETD